MTFFSDGPSATPPETLRISAAASLRDAITAVTDAYSRRGGVGSELQFDSSTALRVQIEEGAEADVFLSADLENPERLAAAGLIDGEPRAFAANELAIVVPNDNPAGLESPADLATPGLAIIAAGDEVPITAYASELLANLAALAGDPSGFEAAYAANVTSREENVRAVLTKIELGEGDAAIVYATDALASTGVESIPIPEGTNVAATYAGAVLADAPSLVAARAFFEWLRGPDGQAILADFGFRSPG